MSTTPQSIPDDHPPRTSDTQTPVSPLNASFDQKHQSVEKQFHYISSPNGKTPPLLSKTPPMSKENIARKLQRIDMLLNLVYARVANDRSLEALLPYVSEREAHDLVSNFAYVRHQQDTQELKSGMTDKQTYRIFRHHYRAEQRLADTVRELRHAAAKTCSQQSPEKTIESKPAEVTPSLAPVVVELENNTAMMRAYHLEKVQSELKELSHTDQGDDDLLYMQEFSQAQQISTMQARCVAMKDEYEADDMRKGRVSGIVGEGEGKGLPNETISGPEDWGDSSSQPQAPGLVTTGFGVLNREWTPPDPPRLPCPKEHLPQKADKTDAAYVNSHVALHGPGNAEDNLLIVPTKDYRQRRSRRQRNNGQLENTPERREHKTFRYAEAHEKNVRASGLPERRGGTRKSFMFANPKRKDDSRHHEDHHRSSRQRRYSRNRPPLLDHSQGRRHHVEDHTLQFNPKRPGRPHGASGVHGIPKKGSQVANYTSAMQSGYQYSNTEFATMPNLNRHSFGNREKTSYDDTFVRLQGHSGRSQYTGGYSIDPFQKPFPHESVDAFGWKPPEGSGSQNYPGPAAPGQPGSSLPQPGDPYAHPNLSSSQQGGRHTAHAEGGQLALSTKARKRDDLRYTDGPSSGLIDRKEGVGVMQSIANKMKGKKPSLATPQNPIEAMQLAKRDPVKFMTTMVAGEILPQAKRKARKFEGMLVNEALSGRLPEEVGDMFTKMTKESKKHGGSSKTGVHGQMGQMLAKVALDSAAGGGSSKANAKSQVGNVLAKVAKESMKQAGGSSGGAGMMKKVMDSLANT